MEKKPIITLNSEEKDFLFRIDSEIKSILFELPVQYHEILQVVNGSRFRPLLTYYGYKLFSENLNEKVYKSPNDNYLLSLVYHKFIFSCLICIMIFLVKIR